ncbi:MAG: hypothetical protein WCC63_01085 [Candidatus Bathyarchaeia archaeon]
MNRRKVKAVLRFLLSQKAMALPVSFLMLFVSLTLIISATYYVSVTKIEARGRLLNIAVAKQNMLYLADAVESAEWSPGASSVYKFEDSGGAFKTHPAAKNLQVNVSDGTTFYAVVFNSSVGKVVYELPSAEVAVYIFYLKGDSRALINQSAFSTTQLYLSPGASSPELTLAYRPLATISETGFNEGKPVNTLRLYVISLNTSDAVTAEGEFSIKATCVSVTSTLQTYDFSAPIISLSVRATLDGKSGTVIVPVESNSSGALVKVETLICSIRLERIQGGG